MSALIEQLQEEHNVLVSILEEVVKLGISSQAGQDKLQSAKAGLLAHLAKEDEHLYPVLVGAADQDEALKRTLDRFATDMDTISKVALDFFDKYANGGSGIEYAKDYGQLKAALSNRIRNEESVLYKEYEKQQG